MTSVIAVTPATSAKSAPGLFNWHMTSVARPWCSASSLLFFSAVVSTPMPSGLVRNSLVPACAALFFFTSSVLTMPVTAKPKIGSGASIEWPPANAIPACWQA
ncbi:hypothetical protein D3C80_1506390 [compost metagenome]